VPDNQKEADMSLRNYILPVAFSLLIAGALGCVSHHAIHRAREDGARSGTSEGQVAGKAAGLKAGIATGEQLAYMKILNERLSSGDFHRVPLFYLATVVGAFLCGHGLQYLITYALRRLRLLHDIDWFLLPEELTSTDLARMLSFLLALSFLTGCQSEEQKAWKEGLCNAFAG
jgi:hypothetical protein